MTSVNSVVVLPPSLFQIKKHIVATASYGRIEKNVETAFPDTHDPRSSKSLEAQEPKNSYDSIATVGESRVWWRAYFQSGSRVLKKAF